MNKVIVSFTTLPSRFQFIEPMVECIVNQSYQDFEFHLNIPKYSDLEHTDYVVPSWASKYPKLQIHTADRDWGSHTKLIPTLKRENDPNTIIITVDDDYVYHQDTIKTHMEIRATKHPNAAICFAGRGLFEARGCDAGSVDRPLLTARIHMHLERARRLGTASSPSVTSVEKDHQVRIIEGYKSASYIRHFLDPVYYSCARLHWCDDTTISCMLGKNNIKKYVCAWPGETNFSARVKSFPIVEKLSHQWGPSGCIIRSHTAAFVSYVRALQASNDSRVKKHTDRVLIRGVSPDCIMGVPYAEEVFKEWCSCGWYDNRGHD